MATAQDLNDLVKSARAGDLDAYGRLVPATQRMAIGAAVGVVRDRGLAEDAVQDAYLRAFRRLADLDESAAFIGWFRRIVITVALNMRRAHRRTLLRLDDEYDVPVLDEAETRWTDLQRHRLAGALLTLTTDERRLCWSSCAPSTRTTRKCRSPRSSTSAKRDRGRSALHHRKRAASHRQPPRAWIRPHPAAAVVDHGRWYEVLAWGVFTDRIVRHLGADPAVHRAIGVGHYLERLAMLRYGIDDIQRIDGARVA